MLEFLENMHDKITLRPSSLPSWTDCERRTAANLFRPLITAAGFTINYNRNNIGATIGTATHKGASTMLEHKMKTGEIGRESDAQDAALAEFDEDLEEGVMWDEVTGGRNEGQKQIIRMVHTYKDQVAPKIEPIAVEQRLNCDLGDGFVISGQADAIVMEPGTVRDLKTGKIKRSNASQIGAYSLIRRAPGRDMDIQKLLEDYIPRVRISKPQPPAEEISYNVHASEQEAFEIIKDMKWKLSNFLERLAKQDHTAPPEYAFRANPQSMLCSDKYCPVFGTDFCRLHKGAI